MGVPLRPGDRQQSVWRARKAVENCTKLIQFLCAALSALCLLLPSSSSATATAAAAITTSATTAAAADLHNFFNLKTQAVAGARTYVSAA